MSSSHELQLVLEQPDFIVVNKPIGVPMHDAEQGIIPLCQRVLGESQLHLVHRLDTVTSGCLLLARTPSAAAALGQQFAARTTNKYYLALTQGKPKKKQGTIKGDMVNRRSGTYALTNSSNNPAITQFFSFGLSDGIRLALVKPLTGKTHQIRVALKSNGCPIIGDERYGGIEGDRTYLHAWQLHFHYAEQTFCAVALPQQGSLFNSEAMTDWLHAHPDPQQCNWPGKSQ